MSKRTITTLLAAAALLACSSGGSSSSSSGAPAGTDAGGAGSKPNPLNCPVDPNENCPFYYCACQAGTATASSWSSRNGSCLGPEATCADFCRREQTPSPATEFRCGLGPRPPVVDAGLPRGSAGGPCLAGDICSERDFANCADLTVQLMRSVCPASGVCPTKDQAEATACATHGGPQRI
ncbi:MAG: hypothetical protein HOO96_28585 [Polyangiaceae bacterium]|nr:hypothetical protein [Polyangiaceae bacterium]